jgi:hypothetical protein
VSSEGLGTGIGSQRCRLGALAGGALDQLIEVDIGQPHGQTGLVTQSRPQLFLAVDAHREELVHAH